MAVAKPTETLFVTGLPMDCTSEQANKTFSQYGSVKSATVLPVAAGKNAAAAFIIMETVEQAKWIVDNLNGNIPDGFASPVTVVFATPREQRFGGKGMKGKGMMKGMMNMMSMMMGFGGGKGYGYGGKPYDPARKAASYKTVLCNLFEQNGYCPRPEGSCTFAHGAHELRPKGKGKGGGMMGMMG
eukprot:Skav213347  [mRNA]  locus=scaffold3041:50218:60615:- [translate_table: standard]